MDDLISRQAAIDAILHNQELYSNNFGSDPIDRYTIAIIDNDAQTIAQLPSAQPEQKWIPCEEALPNKNGFYEVTVSSPYKPVQIYEYKPCDLYENENRWKSEDGCYALNWFVKAWRECPKPYERSEDEK